MIKRTERRWTRQHMITLTSTARPSSKPKFPLTSGRIAEADASRHRAAVYARPRCTPRCNTNGISTGTSMNTASRPQAKLMTTGRISRNTRLRAEATAKKPANSATAMSADPNSIIQSVAGL